MLFISGTAEMSKSSATSKNQMEFYSLYYQISEKLFSMMAIRPSPKWIFHTIISGSTQSFHVL